MAQNNWEPPPPAHHKDPLRAHIASWLGISHDTRASLYRICTASDHWEIIKGLFSSKDPVILHGRARRLSLPFHKSDPRCRASHGLAALGWGVSPIFTETPRVCHSTPSPLHVSGPDEASGAQPETWESRAPLEIGHESHGCLATICCQKM